MSESDPKATSSGRNPRAGRRAAAFSARRTAVRQNIAFRFERFLARGAHTKVALVWGLLLLLSLMGGALGWMAPAGEFASPGDAVWWAFLRLSDPGYLADDHAPGMRLLAIGLTVLGLTLFVGVLVAILTQAFNRRMERLALGLTPVGYAGHVAVVGWTNRTLELIAALLEEQESPPRVAVLVERITPEIDQALSDRLPRGLRSRVVLRTGDPERLEHLARIRGSHAQAIVLPGSDRPGPDGDLRTLKVIASLDRTAEAGETCARVVAEIVDPKLLPVARAAYAGELQLIPSDLLVARSLALGIVTPGLSPVLSDLLDVRSGCTLRVERHPALAGETIASASARFATAVLMGTLRGGDGDRDDGVERAGDTRLREDDRLLLLAPVRAALEPEEVSPGEDGASRPWRAEATAATTLRVLIVGWSGKVPDLYREVDKQHERAQIDVLARVDVHQREALLPAEADGPALRHLVGDPTSPDVFDALDLAEYHRIVVIGNDSASDAFEADSETIAILLLLWNRLGATRERPHLIAELLDPANRAVLDGRDVELVVTPDLLAGLLAGVTSHPELMSLFDRMLHGDLGFTPGLISLEGLAGAEETTFGAIERWFRTLDAVCIGLQREATGFALELVPAKRDPLRVGPRDRAVVVLPRPA